MRARNFSKSHSPYKAENSEIVQIPQPSSYFPKFPTHSFSSHFSHISSYFLHMSHPMPFLGGKGSHGFLLTFPNLLHTPFIFFHILFTFLHTSFIFFHISFILLHKFLSERMSDRMVTVSRRGRGRGSRISDLLPSKHFWGLLKDTKHVQTEVSRCFLKISLNYSKMASTLLLVV